MLKTQFKDWRANTVTLEAPGKTIGKGKVNDIVIDADGVGGFHEGFKVEGVKLKNDDTIQFYKIRFLVKAP